MFQQRATASEAAKQAGMEAHAAGIAANQAKWDPRAAAAEAAKVSGAAGHAASVAANQGKWSDRAAAAEAAKVSGAAAHAAGVAANQGKWGPRAEASEAAKVSGAAGHAASVAANQAKWGPRAEASEAAKVSGAAGHAASVAANQGKWGPRAEASEAAKVSGAAAHAASVAANQGKWAERSGESEAERLRRIREHEASVAANQPKWKERANAAAARAQGRRGIRIINAPGKPASGVPQPAQPAQPGAIPPAPGVPAPPAVPGPPPAVRPPGQRRAWTFRSIFGDRQRMRGRFPRGRRGRAYYLRRKPGAPSAQPVPGTPAAQPGQPAQAGQPGQRPAPPPPQPPGVVAPGARKIGRTSVRDAIERAKRKYSDLYKGLSKGLYMQEIIVLGERVALQEDKYDFETQKDIVPFTETYFPDLATDPLLEEGKVIFSKVFSPGSAFSYEHPLPPCSAEEAKLLLRGLRGRFETLRTDVMKRRDVYGDSVFLREGLEHLLRLKALVERLEDAIDCQDYDKGPIQPRGPRAGLDMSDERLRNLVRQFIFLVLQSMNTVDEFKSREQMDAIEFVEMLETNPLSRQEFNDFVALYTGRNFKIPPLIAQIMKLLEGNTQALSFFLESETADLVTQIRKTIEGNLAETDKTAPSKLLPEFQRFVQGIQSRPAREQIYEMLLWVLTEFGKVQAQFAKLQSDHDTNEFKFQQALKKARECEEAQKSLRSQYDVLKTAYDQFRRQTEQLKRDVNDGFEGQQRIEDEAKSQEDAYRTQFEELQRRIAEGELELQRVNDDRGKLENLLTADRQTYLNSQQEVARLGAVLAKLEQDLKSKTTENEGLNRRLVELQARLSETERSTSGAIDGREKEIAGLKERQRALEQELATKVRGYEEQIASLKAQLTGLQAKIAGTAEAAALVKELQARIDALTKEKADLQRRLDECLQSKATTDTSQAIVPAAASTSTGAQPTSQTVVPYTGPDPKVEALQRQLTDVQRERQDLQGQIVVLQRQQAAASAAGVAAASAVAKIRDLQAQIDALRKERTDLVNQQAGQITKVRGQLEQERASMVEDLKNRDTQIAALNKEIGDLKALVAAAKTQHETQLSELKAAHAKEVARLTGQRDEVSSKLAALEDTTAANNQQLVLLTQQRDQLATAQTTLQGQLKQLQDENKETAIVVRNQITAIEVAKKGRQTEIDQLALRIRDEEEEANRLRNEKADLIAELANRSEALAKREATIKEQAAKIEELTREKALKDDLQKQLLTLNRQLQEERGRLETLRASTVDKAAVDELQKEQERLRAGIETAERETAAIQQQIQIKDERIRSLEKDVQGFGDQLKQRGETISKFQQETKQLQLQLKQQSAGLLTKLQKLGDAVQMGLDGKGLAELFPAKEDAPFLEIMNRLRAREQGLRKQIADKPAGSSTAIVATQALSSTNLCYLNYVTSFFLKQLFFNHPHAKLRTNAYQILDQLLTGLVAAQGGATALPDLVEECFKLLEATESHFLAKQSRTGVPITEANTGVYVLEGRSADFLRTLYDAFQANAARSKFQQAQKALEFVLPDAFPNLGFQGTSFHFNPPVDEEADGVLDAAPNFLYLQQPDEELAAKRDILQRRYFKVAADGSETTVNLATPLNLDKFLENGISYATMLGCYVILARQYILSIEPKLKAAQCSIPNLLRNPASVMAQFQHTEDPRKGGIVSYNSVVGKKARSMTQGGGGSSDVVADEPLATLLRFQASVATGSGIPSKRALLTLRNQIRVYDGPAYLLKEAFNRLLSQLPEGSGVERLPVT